MRINDEKKREISKTIQDSSTKDQFFSIMKAKGYIF